MITHYIALSFRSILRNKIFSAINITGLTIGLIAFFLIAQYVSYELGFDRFHKNYQQLYRVVNQTTEKGVVTTSAINFLGMRQLIRENFPDVKATGFMEVPIDVGITYGRNGQSYWEGGKTIQADTALFSVFTGLLIKGNPSNALKDPHVVIFSEKVATKTFGEEDPLHQQLEDLTDFGDFGEPTMHVTGVFRDLPVDSHLHFEAITPIDNEWDTVKNFWDIPGIHTYIKVPEGTDESLIETRLNTLLAEVAKKFPNVKGSQAKLQAVTDIHLGPGLVADLEPRTSVALPLTLSVIALCILFIAWINYINLETARFITQAREVGIRRVIGSTRMDLALQFVTRYFCLNAFAVVLAVVGILLIIPHFSYFTGIPLSKLDFSHYKTWAIALGLYISGSMVAGIYPVLLLLKLNPATIIKGTTQGSRSGKLKTILIVVQYVTSISLIVFVTVAEQQLDFMRLTDKKMDIERVVAIENSLAYTEYFEGESDKFPVLRDLLKTHPSVSEVSVSSNIPGREINFTLVNEMKRNKQDPFDPRRFKLLFIDYNYIPMYGLKLKAGRNYKESEAIEDNTGRIILNEAAINALGFKSADEAINQYIYFQLWPFMKPQIEIVGILEDHHHQAVKEIIEPTIYFSNMGRHQQVYYSVKINKGADMQESLAFIETSYKKLFPKNPFNYIFVDTLYEKQFQSDVHFARVFGLFSGVASFLACLGILGITLFETNTRLKEISIRKVLGASATGIVALLSKNNVKVVVISLLVAVPAAYYASLQWLLNYPVRIDLTATPFVVSAISIGLLTMVASGVQTFKAAQSNPVDHLKNE